MVRCPACQSLLYRRRLGSISLEGCPACGGVFADAGELQQLAQEPSQLSSAAKLFPPGIQPAIEPQRTNQCPKCAEALSAFEYRQLRGVRLDRCPKCQGVWLDHGELEQIGRVLVQAAMPVGEEAAVPAVGPEDRGEALEAANSISPSVAARFSAAAGARSAPAPGPAAPAPATPAESTADLPVVRGAILGAIDRSPGFLASLERALRFLLAAYRLAFQKPALLVPLAAGGVLQVAGGIAVVVAVVRAATGGLGLAGRTADLVVWCRAQPLLAFLVPALLIAAGHLLNIGVAGMTVSLVDAYLKGRPLRLGTALRDVARNALGLLGLAAVGLALGMATGRGQRGRGLFAYTVDAVWKAVASLLLPIVMIEDVGLIKAMRRARQVHENGLVQIAVGEVGLRAVAGIITLAVLGLALFAGLGMGSPTLAKVAVLLVVLLVALVAVGVLNAFARGAYYTCLYLWAREVERASEPAQAMVPGPLAAALEG